MNIYQCLYEYLHEYLSININMHTGYIICVPLATWRIIYQNKPRGSSEDANYRFDAEGNKVKFTEEMYQETLKRMKDSKDKEYNPWVYIYV